MIEYPGPEVKRGQTHAMGRADDRRILLRSTASVALPTFFSRVLGYVRDFLQALFMGTGLSADAFIIAFTIPNVLRRLTAEGAMTAAFVPTFSEMRREKEGSEAWAFATAIFYDLALVMAAVAALGVLFAPAIVRVIAFGFRNVPGKVELTVGLTRIMFPFIVFVSLSALAAGILNVCRRFFVPASTPILFNLAVIGGAIVLAGEAKEPAFVFAAAVLVGGALQILFQIPFLRREGMRFRFGLSFAHPAVRRVSALMVPGILGASVYQINFAVSRMIASALEEGSASALYYASRIEELTLGLFTVALSIALLPAFSEQAAARDTDRMKETVSFSLRLVTLVTVPAAAGLIVLNEPIIRILFERGAFDAESTAMSSACLMYFAIGLPFISGVKILAPAFFALKDTVSPVIVGACVMAVNVGLSLALMGPLRVGGLALALSLAQVLNFAALFIWIEKKTGGLAKRRLAATLLKALCASGMMIAALLLVRPALTAEGVSVLRQAPTLLGTIVLGIGTYAAVIRLLSPEETKSLLSILFKRKSPGSGD